MSATRAAPRIRSAWRLTMRRHAASAFSGEGARLHGGRWNPKGRAVVYTATTLALAALEYLVHVDTDLLPSGLIAIEVSWQPDVVVEMLDETRLPPRWQAHPAPPELQEIGRAWLDGGESALLAVPSAIIPAEKNVLINPTHPDARRLGFAKPVPFRLDPRLRRK